jgi:hypothetical protein
MFLVNVSLPCGVFSLLNQTIFFSNHDVWSMPTQNHLSTFHCIYLLKEFDKNDAFGFKDKFKLSQYF